jgi:hypothetical protein
VAPNNRIGSSTPPLQKTLFVKINFNNILPTKGHISWSFITKIPVLFIFLLRATCPADLILSYLITLMKFPHDYILLNFLWCNFHQSALTLPLLASKNSLTKHRVKNMSWRVVISRMCKYQCAAVALTYAHIAPLVAVSRTLNK